MTKLFLLTLALMLATNFSLAKEISNEAKVGGFAIGPQAYSFKGIYPVKYILI
jgi:hypothetical protein